MPFLIQIDEQRPGKYLRANRVSEYKDVEHGDWKLLIWDEKSGRARMPKGTIGFRWGDKEKGKWNLEPKDGLTNEDIEPQLSFAEAHDEVVDLELK